MLSLPDAPPFKHSESARFYPPDPIVDALDAWIVQRPGLEPGNYISHGRDEAGRRAYRTEAREIVRDLHDAQRLLGAIRWQSPFSAAEWARAFGAFSGRLTWDGTRLEYCTGQYWPMEYRKAVCAVLASLIWSISCREWPREDRHDLGVRLRRQFGRGLMGRWFPHV
jgi:hypothetical protein